MANNTNGNPLFAEQASIMQAACNAVAVPQPPISFNQVTACAETVRGGVGEEAVGREGRSESESMQRKAGARSTLRILPCRCTPDPLPSSRAQPADAPAPSPSPSTLPINRSCLP
jgi:hypothetical protein